MAKVVVAKKYYSTKLNSNKCYRLSDNSDSIIDIDVLCTLYRYMFMNMIRTSGREENSNKLIML